MWEQIALSTGFTLFGAFAYRHRGGFLPTGHTQVARTDFAIMIALLFFGREAFLHSTSMTDWMWMAAAILLVWVFTFIDTLIGHAKWMGADTPLKVFMLGVTGLVNVMGLITVFWWWNNGHPLDPAQLSQALLHHWPVYMILAGALKSGAYVLGNYTPSITRWSPHFDRGPVWGEWYFGALIGLGVSLS